jgi:predicted AlkP superfamily phosphohydrolase/phosphomutase
MSVNKHHSFRFYIFINCFFLLLTFATEAKAYIGPGAGFAFIGSFFAIFFTFILAFFVILSWPLRYLISLIRGDKKNRKNQKVKKLVILGLDGLDPLLVKRYSAEGKLPNLKKLGQEGCYYPLKTTTPSISPVAWSSFSTGVNPAKHNIYDFLTRNRSTYLPDLSSTYLGKVNRSLKIGKYIIPLSKPELRLLRKGKPFWTLLGEQGIISSILRVPITFPPEKFNGRILSAMCVPDLKGTQGSFTQFTTHLDENDKTTGGERILVERKNGCFHTEITGPQNPILKNAQIMKIPLEIRPGPGIEEATLHFNGQSIPIKIGQYSNWVKLDFKAGLGINVSGIGRFLLNSIEPEFSLYLSPINIDPEKPALPVSYPAAYSVYMSKLLGPYATLGLAEDTWALNERVIDEKAFLDQTYNIHKEREAMFFNELDKLRNGVLVTVFDITDRIQHMFFRYLEDDHPANRDKDRDVHKQAIERLYCDMDQMVGRVREKLDEDTVLIIMSDHGFTSFKRGINLNSWLHQHGYLVLKDGLRVSDDYFQGVDWGKTKAFAVGLGGIFLNIRGREKEGVIQPGEEEEKIKGEIIEKLAGLKDPQHNREAIRTVYDSKKVYKGPYTENAPDLIIGFQRGFRTSWEAVTGQITEQIFSDNEKSWSGDHCIDPELVPGVFFCNRKIDDDSPSIVDIAPTVLHLFGLEIPSFYDGKSLFNN